MAASTPIITENWGYALEPNIIAIWDEEAESFTNELNLISLLYDVRATDKRVSTMFGVGAGGTVPTRAEGGDLVRQTREQLYKLTLTQVPRDLGVDITEEMIRYGEYAEIARMIRELSTQFYRTMLEDAFSSFNNAFSSSYTGPDGVSLCSASHPTSPTDATTKSNTGTSVLSHDAVVSTRTLMRKFTNSQGIKMNVIPDILLVPIDLESTAVEIVESMGKSGVADNDMNFIKSTGMQVLVSSYLSDTNNWFLVDSRLARLYHVWEQSDAPTIALSERASKYRVNTYAGHMAYDRGWATWQWVYGHNVT